MPLGSTITFSAVTVANAAVTTSRNQRGQPEPAPGVLINFNFLDETLWENVAIGGRRFADWVRTVEFKRGKRRILQAALA